MTSGRTYQTAAAVALVLGTAALLPIGGVRGGATTSFVPAMLAIVLSFDLLSVYLLAGEFRDTGEPRLLAMAAAYVWSLVLMVGYAAAFPGVLSSHPPFAATPSVAPWLYIGWHAGFPVLLGVAWAPWPDRLSLQVLDGERTRTSRLSLAAVGLVAAGVVAAVVGFAHRLPVIIHGLDTSRMATLTAPVAVPLVALALTAAVRGSWRRAGAERWTAVTVLACLCDLALTYSSHFRFSLGWYAGRVLTLVSAGVVLVALLADVRRTKARAQHNAAHDELTGLYNRRSVHDQLDQLVARSHRTGAPLSVLLLDLDRFKNVNDTYGHAAGDVVLRGVSAALRQHVRRGDVVARIGGEEFLVLLPDTSLDAAHTVAEKLRTALLCVPSPGGQVTASIGATALLVGDGSELLLRRADQAMYRAKTAGRDRVIYADSPEPTVPSPAPVHA